LGQKIEELPPYTRALLKSHLISAGHSYDDLKKPVIAVANSWNEFNHGHIPQKEVAEKIKSGIRSADGLPIEFHTIGPCDGLAVGNPGMRFILPSREIIADSVEATIRGHPIFDGLVLISSCDKITPGMLMAAARLRIPAIHIAAGPALPAISFAQSRSLRKEFLDGRISERELAVGNSQLYSTCGNCPYIGTANTMNCLAEALGMALPGSAVVPAVSPRRLEFVQETGEAIVNLVASGLNSQTILTRGAFDNALRVAAAIGGSSNYILHMPAIAAELGIEVTLSDIGEINRTTPLLCQIAPNGTQSVVDLDNAGGIPAVMKELRPLLNLGELTAKGCVLGDSLETTAWGNREVIYPFSEPLSPEGGIVILTGNLAPGGAVVKRSAVPPELYKYRGPARVFTGEESCLAAVQDNLVSGGDVLVVMFEGPKGGPGMREMHRLTGVLRAFGDNIALITDGRFSGADSGLVIGYITPEAADSGPLGIVHDGDIIEIDLNSCSLNVELTDGEIRSRLVEFNPLEKQITSSVLRRYRSAVNPASKGAVVG
jgi:dihydroxy-acid dehydratase